MVPNLQRSLYATLICFLLSGAAQAKLNEDQIREAIKHDNASHGDAQVAITATQASISTFRAENATDKDCKIDAILLAKTVFDRDPELLHVLVRFHDLRNHSEYWEANVSVSDVAAYGAGAISKDQLLNVMELKHLDPAGTATPPPAVSEGVPGEHLPVAPKRPALTSTTIPKSSALPHYEAYGLSLRYPARWTANKPSTGNALLRLTVQDSGEHPAIIELRVYSTAQVKPQTLLAASPEVTFNDPWKLVVEASMPPAIRKYMQGVRLENESFLRNNPGMGNPWYNVSSAPVKIAPTIKVGQTHSLTASQKAYWVASRFTPREYMRTVVIPSSKYIYQLNMVAPQADSKVIDTEFEQMLALLTVAATK